MFIFILIADGCVRRINVGKKSSMNSDGLLGKLRDNRYLDLNITRIVGIELKVM